MVHSAVFIQNDRRNQMLNTLLYLRSENYY